MRLIHFLTLRMAIAASVVFALWTVVFYYAIIAEVNDEQDDALEDHAELVMRRFLRGETVPSEASGSNNQYYLHPVTDDYASKTPAVRYLDHEVYINDKHEYEPARSIYYIFQDQQGRYYEVGVSMPTIDKEDLKMSLWRLMVVLYIALIVTFVAISQFSVRRTMRPLKRLLAWMERYRPGQANSELDNPTRIDEFKRLNASVADLTHKSEQYERQQQLFISNASHEMQTPLAISIGRLESLMEQESLTPQQMEELGKTLSTLEGLSHLGKTLLMLSRIDNGQYAADEDIDLAAIIAQHLPDYQELYADKHVTVHAHDLRPMTVTMDKHLASILVLNLLKNAFVHVPAGGEIVLECDGNSLSLANSGEGGALDEEKIFLPFHHSGNNKHSVGLGLPLVRAVGRRYNMPITYHWQDGMHVFCVTR